MVCMITKRCLKCKRDFLSSLDRHELYCSDCDPEPKKEEFHCPGCCVCKGGWVPESERRY